MDWVANNIIGLEVEISSRPPSENGFVPVKWRWLTERTFGIFNFFRKLDKDKLITICISDKLRDTIKTKKLQLHL